MKVLKLDSVGKINCISSMLKSIKNFIISRFSFLDKILIFSYKPSTVVRVDKRKAEELQRHVSVVSERTWDSQRLFVGSRIPNALQFINITRPDLYKSQCCAEQQRNSCHF
jgi:hypothetical protein